MYQYDTMKELREVMRGRTIREVMVTGVLTDARSIELRFTDSTKIEIEATPYGTLKIGASL